jgi:hypothetical protein
METGSSIQRQRKKWKMMCQKGAQKMFLFCYCWYLRALLLLPSFGSQQATTGDVSGDHCHCGLIDGDWIQGHGLML